MSERCGACARCRLAARDPRYAKFACAGGPAVASRAVVASRPDTGPCPHVGRAVSVAGTIKAYHRCDHPDRVALRLAEVTCACAGCGPRCPGYPAGE